MYTITINSKSGTQKVIRTGPTFGKDAKGNRLTPVQVQDLARDIAWDTFGVRVASVTCVKPKG